MRRETAQLRKNEPWFPAAFAALEAIGAGNATADRWQAITPFSYGRWDEAAWNHREAEEQQTNREIMTAFGAEGAFDPAATRTTLAIFARPVPLLAGELDVAAPPRVISELQRPVS